MTFFDPTTVETVERTPLEPGTYRMLVEKVESKTSQLGGPYVSMTLTCIDEPFKNRKVWQNFLVAHPKQEVRNISLGQMKSFLEAVGYFGRLEHENDFHNIALNKVLPVAIGIRKNQQGEEQNNVRSFLPKDAPKTASAPVSPAKRAAPPVQQGAPSPQSNWTQDPALSDIPFDCRRDDA